MKKFIVRITSLTILTAMLIGFVCIQTFAAGVKDFNPAPITEIQNLLKTDENNSIKKYYTYNDAVMIAKVIYNEARGVSSQTIQACIAWTILNRVDDGRFGSTITEVITIPNQFAYTSDAKTTDDYGRDLIKLSLGVLERWNREKNGECEVGRVIPSNYVYFAGGNGRIYFRSNFKTYNYWDYSLKSPYET